MPQEFEVIDKLTINTSDRIAIFGRTGSGKTFFAKNWLLPHYTHYVFWDIKHQNNDVIHEIISKNPAQLKTALETHTKILYQPTSLTDGDFDRICEIIFKHGNTTLYVDESAAISTPARVQYWHKVLVTQGRSYNVGNINVSQRPRSIHNTLISEAEHFFQFSLNLETDVSKVRQQVGDAADEIRFLPDYHFMYYNVKSNKAYLFKPAGQLDTEKFMAGEIPKLQRYVPSLDDYVRMTHQQFVRG